MAMAGDFSGLGKPIEMKQPAWRCAKLAASDLSIVI